LDGSTAAMMAAKYGYEDCSQMIEAERERLELVATVELPGRTKPAMRM